MHVDTDEEIDGAVAAILAYTVEPLTATVRAISSSLWPASAASNIWARLSLRAARLPLLNIAVSSPRSAWLNSTR